ncbi:hypothetical protein I6A84_33835 [Frankia sp. CNm7]|uniref:Uncharacterized protein n=1 Tax=Frankia nepalensis TaxID=1836974 RepID=A0A937UTK9_9ACTN|nr:hypothetical protein [Frankia nepalensis]MBL7498317.1 hypothetical protein [Frankia nepalensis]MBL7512986.1 hypothetical protein [Frankia nepalensis]MBL7522936.1 hypothetical protein [Frankia nepalensis]MBL7630136.1 hypothetical protein [Frankia nepalensis]
MTSEPLTDLVAATNDWIALPRKATAHHLDAALAAAEASGDQAAGSLAAEIRAYQAGAGGPHGAGRWGPGAAENILRRHVGPGMGPTLTHRTTEGDPLTDTDARAQADYDTREVRISRSGDDDEHIGFVDATYRMKSDHEVGLAALEDLADKLLAEHGWRRPDGDDWTASLDRRRLTARIVETVTVPKVG